MTYTLLETHEILLRQATAIRQGTSLPPKLLAKYWEAKRVFDRMNTGMQPLDFARLAIDCGYGAELPQEAAPTSVVQLWRGKKIKSQADVVVLWRGELTPGKLVRVNADGECVVRIGSDPQEQIVKSDLVTLAAAA